MANPEHVEVAGQGAEAVARWRETNPDDLLDLSGANLLFADLSYADLSHADLHNAHLSLANLSRANLSHVFLADANLSHSNLSHAILSSADLSRAILSSANLVYADFSRVILDRTTFTDVDLSSVKGLERVGNFGASSIGVDTLFRSHGKIPSSFLKGCGVPDVLIEYLPTLINSMEPIQFYSCFLSHSSKNEEFTKRLHGRMEQEKLRVWYAPDDMRGGRKVEEQIDRAIQLNDRLLLILSEHSMNSNWVRREIKKARKKEKESGRDVLFPISLVSIEEIKAWECLDPDTGEDLAEQVREYHIPNFENWKDHDAFKAAFADLMRDLRREDEERAAKANV